MTIVPPIMIMFSDQTTNHDNVFWQFLIWQPHRPPSSGNLTYHVYCLFVQLLASWPHKSFPLIHSVIRYLLVPHCLVAWYSLAPPPPSQLSIEHCYMYKLKPQTTWKTSKCYCCDENASPIVINHKQVPLYSNQVYKTQSSAVCPPQTHWLGNILATTNITIMGGGGIMTTGVWCYLLTAYVKCWASLAAHQREWT
jgi:hypothetical protein